MDLADTEIDFQIDASSVAPKANNEYRVKSISQPQAEFEASILNRLSNQLLIFQQNIGPVYNGLMK